MVAMTGGVSPENTPPGDATNLLIAAVSHPQQNG
jgi:hypothetical protein